jgi:3-phosphoglycerate kinase
MVNRAFVLGNLSDRAGRVKPENSMRVVHNTLQKLLPEQSVVFLDDAIIPDFEHKKENEFFPEQTTFLLENLNFKPDEFGYVEPEKPVIDEAAAAAASAAEEEAKRIEEEKLAAAQKGKPGGPPPKAAAPADKKKEEEAKKKAEEEAAAKRKQEEAALAASGGKVLSEEEKAEQLRQKEEAERLKREAEYFDYKTTHRYKGLLGRYGEIYVNDAPLTSLSSSNSVSEIKCKRKVMGVKMTEELRKLCLFFLKKHPKDILDLWYNQPTPCAYHEREFCALVGGSLHSVQDLLDRILLVNALLDQTNTIYLGG